MHEELDTLQAENRLSHVWSTEAHEVKTKPGTVWARKKGIIGAPDLSDIAEKLELGKTFQEPIMRVWAARNRIDFQDADYAMYHPTVAMASHFDYIQADKSRLFEVKNVSEFQAKHYGEEGSHHIPPYYRDQCLHEAAVHGIPSVTLVVCFGGQAIRHFDLNFSTNEIDDHVQFMAQFWAKVATDIQPEDLPEEAVRAMYPISRPASIVATSQVAKACAILKEVKERIKILQGKAENPQLGSEEWCKRTIMSYLGQNDTLLDVDGSVLATFKTAKSGKTFDVDALQKEMPEVYKRYLKETTGSRRFLLK